MSFDERLARHKKLVKQIRPILGGHGFEVHSSVLAELLATFLGGCPAHLRDAILANHLEAVRDLIPHVEVNKSTTTTH